MKEKGKKEKIMETKRLQKAKRGDQRQKEDPRPSRPSLYYIRCSDNEQMCALDPGVRKFLTGYSPEGSSFVLGSDTTRVLMKCIRRIDRTKAKYMKTLAIARASASKRERRSTSKKKRLSGLLRIHRKNYHRAESKAGNVVRDLHYKASHFLCQSFDEILFPNFNAHALVQGHLNKLVKRRLNMLSFYKFRERLKQTATFYPGVVIKSGSEDYTSKQCGKCGVLNESLGSSEVFKCSECGLKADRDLHAARNILLRHLA